MGEDEGQEDEGPGFPWLPPDDRLWRHPSEVGSQPPTLSVPSGPTGPAAHVWTVAMAAGVVGALVASAVLIAVGAMHARTTTKYVAVPDPHSPTSVLATKTVPADSTMLWTQVVESLAPSVVSVSTTAGGSQASSGSGVVFDVGLKETDIITAYDLVSGGGPISVSFNGGQSQPAKMVGSDPTTGIAVVSVAKPPNVVQPVFGGYADLSPAQEVLVLGANNAASNYTAGPVTSLDQSVTDQNDSTLVGMLEIGAGPVSANTDGGVVVDQAGWVVGIYSLAASGGSSDQDVAYAVPITTAVQVALLLEAGQKPTHPWLGIGSATDVFTAASADPGNSAGALIGSVCANSAAARAGLKPDDLVTSVDGQPVKTAASLVTIVAHTRIGQSVRVAYHTPQGRAQTAILQVADEPAALAC